MLFVSLASVVLIVWLLSFAGGWQRLARHYARGSDFVGRRFHFQSMQLRGWCGYNGCVCAGADPFHLSLGIWPVLRLGHPTLTVPWSDIRATREPGRFVRVVALRFARDPEIVVHISARLARAPGRRDARRLRRRLSDRAPIG